MNIVDGILLFVLSISLVYGFYHGFIQSAASLAGFGVSLLAAILLGPRLAGILSGQRDITGLLANFSDAVVRVGDYELASTPAASVSGSTLSTILSSVSLPAPIESLLRDNILSKAFQSKGLSSINEYVSSTLIQALLSVLSFLACFALAYLLWTFLVSLLRHVFHFPILRQLDWLAGGLFGLARGAALCWLLVLLIPLFQAVVPDEGFARYLQTSTVAGFFRNDGLLMRILRGG